MKKIMGILGLILALGMGFFGCGGGSGGSDNLDLKVYLLNKPEDANADWGMWWWYDYKSEKGTDITVSEKKGSFPTGADSLTQSDEIGSYVTINYDTTHPRLGLLFVDKAGSKQSADIIVPLADFEKSKTLFCLYDNMTGYYTDVTKTYGLVSGSISNADGSEIEVKVYKAEINKDNVSVTASDGSSLTVKNVEVVDPSDTSDTKVYKITIENGSFSKAPYKVECDSKSITAIFGLDLIDDIYNYTDDDLGLTLNADGTATFKCWAPLATEVKLLLYASASTLTSVVKSVDMTRDGETGVWTAEKVNYESNKYYQYQIKNSSTATKVCDIWHTVASADSVASQIASIDDASATPTGWEADYTNPFGNSGAETKSYSDAVIYEMHIRDWGKAVGGDGKFLDFVNSTTIIDHLKDLGVTHVQILPMFDYAEKNSDTNYNWGYNPYHYNVPEGRYVTKDYTDGTQAVNELRQMIKALHDANIAVIMDVVYNHTSGNDNSSLYDMTIPGYFYRQDDSGQLTNGSGCGNEVATQRKMVKKYVIDSLKHWMNDYHINGFRFDLMACHEITTMQEIYEELYQIDKNVMVYGEPWTGGTSVVKNSCTGAKLPAGTNSSHSINGIACFDDNFRDTLIKAGMSKATDKGHIQGNYTDDNLSLALTGKTINDNKRNETGLPALALHYTECHDNYTLFDKLIYSNYGLATFPETITSAQIEKVKPQQILAAAYIFLSQGTPFINGGQEFMRTKKGVGDSYKSPDNINVIDLSFKETYSDVYKVYKGLIALRKANSGAFGANASASATKVSAGVTKYTTGDFLVYFNATDSDVAIETTGYTKVVDVTSGTPTESELPAKVGAKSFVILKK